MAHKDVFWMACDSTEHLRAEYGPFHTRREAEAEARKLGFGYLLRYEHIVGPNEELEEVRCVFIELQNFELQNFKLQNPEQQDEYTHNNGDVHNNDMQNNNDDPQFGDVQTAPRPGVTFHTRCASCGETAVHERAWQAEVWADIHEFEHSRHKVRLFEHARGEGLKEIADWRGFAA
jgi:hypothetical protein